MTAPGPRNFLVYLIEKTGEKRNWNGPYGEYVIVYIMCITGGLIKCRFAGAVQMQTSNYGIASATTCRYLQLGAAMDLKSVAVHEIVRYYTVSKFLVSDGFSVILHRFSMNIITSLVYNFLRFCDTKLGRAMATH